LKKCNDRVMKNPFVSFGNFINDRPKLASVLALVAFIIINIWFISGFRRIVLLLLGVPAEIIDILAPVAP